MSKLPADTVAARELSLFATNDGGLYRRHALPIIANLAQKWAAGKYSPELAVKAWRYLADSAAVSYATMYSTGPQDAAMMFTPATRDLAAAEMRDHYAEHVQELGEAHTRYKIVRMYRDDRPSRTIKRRVSLAEAQEHCSNPKTRGEGWFDGYDRDTPAKR